jgi:methylated-DNA-protein-cysteine methyltransferase-like protein
MPKRATDDRGWERFYRWIRKIPRGRVTTYAGIAALAGNARLARHVGFSLAALRDTRAHHDVPWQRVLGSGGRTRAVVSIKDPVGGGLQRKLLEAEGIEFDARGGVSLVDYGWPKRAVKPRLTSKRRAPARRRGR